MNRPCLYPGCPEVTSATYCRGHAPKKHDGLTTTQRGLGHDYRKNRAKVLAVEALCWICGQQGWPDDPLTADHVIPRSKGGGHERSNLRAAHRSCNSRRGNKPANRGVGVAHDEHGRFAV